MADFTADIIARLLLTKIPEDIKKIEKNKITFSNIIFDPKAIESAISSALTNKKFSVTLGGIETKSLDGEVKTAGENAGKQFSEALIKNINSKVATGSIGSAIAKVDAEYKKLGASAHKELSGVAADLETLTKLHELMATTSDNETLINSYEELNRILSTTKNTLSTYATETKSAAAQQALLTKASTLSNRIQTWMGKNAEAAEKYGDKLRAILELLQKDGLTDKDYTLSSLNFANIQSEAKEAGLVTSSFGNSVKDAAAQLLGLGSGVAVIRKVVNELKEGVKTVIELDDALIDLKKTSTASASDLTSFYYEANKTAKELGVTTKDVIQSAADWSRLGFNLDDAKIMSRVSSIFTSISPDLDIERATDGLISAMKAFGIEAENALDGIASKINIIGNTQGVSNGDLVDVLTRASAAMSEANNSLEDTIALSTAAIEITRDASSVGTALRTNFCAYVQKCA